MSNLIEVKVPDIGDYKNIPVIEVYVKVGDSVAVEDTLVTLESDKATMDVPSTAAGVVREVCIKLGDRVKEGSLLVRVEAQGAAAAPAPAARKPQASNDDVSISVPVMGRIAAGVPIAAIQNQSHILHVPIDLVAGGEHYALEVRGDSMIEAAICDGDYVVIREQPSAVNGDIVAALLDDEATVKTFQRKDGHVWLLPHNPDYSPIDGTHASIMGKVVAVMRRL